jgi:F-type H+-transporting ATPase subunit delta
MGTSHVAAGYARALYDLAVLADAVDATDEGLAACAATLRGSADLRSALTDTSLPVEKQRDVLRDIFGASVTPEVLALVTVLTERGMTGSLTDVARSYREIAEGQRGVVVAEVTTAIPLDDALRASVTDRLTASLGRPAILRETVDASILGGIRIKVAGRVLDGSVSTQLEDVRQALTSAQGGDV